MKISQNQSPNKKQSAIKRHFRFVPAYAEIILMAMLTILSNTTWSQSIQNAAISESLSISDDTGSEPTSSKWKASPFVAKANPFPNPDLPEDLACDGLKIVFVLDESGSVSQALPQTRAGALALATALNNSGAELTVVEFATFATTVNLGGTTVNASFLTNFNNYLYSNHLGQSYAPQNGCQSWTNWQAALLEAGVHDAELIIFFTDGRPTAYNNPNGNCGAATVGSSATIASQALNNAIVEANAIKSNGTHIFAVGIGSTLVSNLISISGPDNFAGSEDIYTDDYAIGSFDDLAENLTSAVNTICGTELSISKTISSPSSCANGQVTFTIAVTNTGGEFGFTAFNTILTDIFPAGFTNLSIVNAPIAGASIVGNTLTYNAGDLTSGSSTSIQITANAPALGGIISNTASAFADNANEVQSSVDLDVAPSTILSCPSPLTLSCGPNIDEAIQQWLASASNNYGTPVDNNYNPTALTNCTAFNVVFTSTDICTGETVTCTSSLTIIDDQAPVVMNPPQDDTYACIAQVPALGPLQALDNCAGNIADQGIEIFGSGTGCAGSPLLITRTWSFTDNCQNTSTHTQTITIEDNQPPSLQIPANAIFECTLGDAGTAVSSDNCGQPNVSFSDQTNINACGSGTIERTWIATDPCGNSSTGVQLITITDTQAPTPTLAPSDITVACPGEVPPALPLEAIDDCSGQIIASPTDQITNQSCPNSYEIIRTWQFQDCSGNQSNVQQVITVLDDVDPTISGILPDVSVDCNEIPPVAVVSASDNCGVADLDFEETILPGSCPQGYTIQRTWTATDQCGNEATASRNITVIDQTAPQIQGVPANIQVACDAIPAAATPTVIDNCDPNPSLSFTETETPGTCPGSYTIERTWSATDDCNNSMSATQNITVVDSDAPALPSAPANMTVACPADVPMAQQLTAVDACSGNISASPVENIVPGACAGQYTIERQWIFADACGNTSQVSQIITVFDDINPVAPDAPANLTLACADDIPAATSLTAQDNCSGSITAMPIETTMPGPCANSFTLTRQWIFADACGNTSTTTQLITVADIEAPVAPSAPPAANYSCLAEVPNPTALFATDNCDGSIPGVVSETNNGAQSCPSDPLIITRIWTFTDFCGNQSSVSQLITIADEVAPQFTSLPAAINNITCNQPLPIQQSLTATDNCGSATVDHLDPQFTEDICNGYTVTYTWQATDNCGNVTLTTRSFQVTPAPMPMISCNPGFEIESTAQINVDLINPANDVTVTTFCGLGATVAVSEPAIAGNGCGGTNYVYTYTVTDDCGRTASCNRTFTVNLPALDLFCPPEATVACASDILPVESDVTVNNPIPDKQTTITIGTPQLISGLPNCHGATYQVSYSVTDECGREATCFRTYTIENVGPQLTAPADQVAACKEDIQSDIAGAVVQTSCGIEAPVFASLPMLISGADSCSNAIYQITYTATDICGRSAQDTQNFILENDGPTITAPGDQNLSCIDDIAEQIELAQVSVDCGLSYEISASEAELIQGTTDCPTQFQITYTAIDVCDRSASDVQFVNIETQQGPLLQVPADISFDCIIGDAGTASATEICGALPNVSFVDQPSLDANGYGTINRIWSAIDGCGNEVSETQVITITDNTPPQALCQNLTIALDQNGSAIMDAEQINAGSSDNCGIQSISVTPSAFGCADLGPNTVVFTVTDLAGNSATCQSTVTVIDNIAPVANCQDINVVLDASGNATISASDINNESSDNCEIASLLISGQTSFDCDDENQTFAVQLTVTDASGNLSSCTANVLVTPGTDSDGDNIGDNCDACLGNDASGDSDADGICNSDDQCPELAFLINGDPCMTADGLEGTVTDCACEPNILFVCADQNACNYWNPANFPNLVEGVDWFNSPEVCQEPEDCFICEGTDGLGNGSVVIDPAQDTNNNGTCDIFENPGCTDDVACNFDPQAVLNDGSCVYPIPNCVVCSVAPPFFIFIDSDGDGTCNSQEILGCTNDHACNYNENATEDDGSCLLPIPGCSACDGENIAIIDADGNNVPDCEEIPGCTDSSACNYDSSATQDNGACLFPIENCAQCLFVQGQWITIPIDTDNDGVCDADEVEGCTNLLACNFNPSATDDDESCLVPVAECTECGTQVIDGQIVHVLLIIDTDLDGVCDANEIPGCTNVLACNYNPAATDEDGSCLTAVSGCTFCVDGILVFQDNDNDGICNNEDPDDDNDGCPDDLDANPLMADADSDIDGVGDSCDLCQGDDASGDSDGDGICDDSEIPGCTNLTACNYDANATDDNGSCIVPVEDCLVCNAFGGLSLVDADGDKICDANEIPGCTDPEACNWDPAATEEDGSCGFPVQDCTVCEDGLIIFVDTDGDGICDADEVPGCTSETACNYNPLATDDNDSCNEPVDDCLECGPSGQLVFVDADNDGICDALENSGCTNPLACNFDDDASDEDGSCLFPTPNCTKCELVNGTIVLVIIDADSDGVCDADEVPGCQNPIACNYNPEATEDTDCIIPTPECSACGEITLPNGTTITALVIVDSDGDKVCDAEEVWGCDNPNAVNFDPEATEDDGSCIVDCTTNDICEAFEDGFGAWQNSTSDDIDWLANTAGTPSNGTGPDAAFEGDNYVYIEASFPNYPNKTAILESPCYEIEQPSVISFAYHMKGRGVSVGQLTLEASVTNSNGTTTFAPIWTVMGNQGSNWNLAQIDVPALAVGGNVRFRLIGTTATSFLGDIAVDQFCVNPLIMGCTDVLANNYDPAATVDDGSCTYLLCQSPATLPYCESFDSGTIGEFEQEAIPNDDFDWSHNSGPTESMLTGPDAGYDGSVGYAYVEASEPNNPFKDATIISTCIDLGQDSDPAVSFAYHMWGTYVGQFFMEITTNGTNWTYIWFEQGDHGDQWLTESISLANYAGQIVRFRITGVTFNGWEGDMAIDDFCVENNPNAAAIKPINPMEVAYADKSKEGITVQEPEYKSEAGLQVKIYPNPLNTSAPLNFEIANIAPQVSNIQLKVFDLTGTVVHEELFSTHGSTLQQRLNLGSRLAGGLYFLSVTAGDELHTVKLEIMK